MKCIDVQKQEKLDQAIKSNHSKWGSHNKDVLIKGNYAKVNSSSLFELLPI